MRFPVTALLIAITGVGWGLIAPTTRLAFGRDPAVLDGASFAVARAVWTGLVWLPAFAWLLMRERRAFERTTPLVLAALGLLWGPGVMGLFAVATQRAALSHVVFSVGLTPVSASLLLLAVRGGTIDAARRASLALGALGVAVLGFERGGAHGSLLGDAVLVVWIVAFGLYATVASLALRTLSAPLVTAAANVVAGASLALAAAAVPAWRAALGEVATHPGLPLPFFGEIVFWGGLVAPLTYAFALGRASVAAVTGGAQYLSIATGTVAAIVLFAEPFGALTILAGLLLAASLGLSLAPQRPRFAPDEVPAAPDGRNLPRGRRMKTP